MKMIFHFKVLSPENENFERDYKVSYDSTLLELHNYIAKDLKFDENEMASFFMSDADWSKQQEFTSEDMFYGEDDSDIDELTPISMDKITLGQIVQQKHERLLYVFDLLSNRGLYLELIKTFKDDDEKNDKYPCTSKSVGEAPIHLENDDVAGEVSEMFDDMYSEDYNDDYNDQYAEEYSENGNSYSEEYY